MNEIIVFWLFHEPCNFDRHNATFLKKIQNLNGIIEKKCVDYKHEKKYQ